MSDYRIEVEPGEISGQSVTYYDDKTGELRDLIQDVKRLDDLLSAYNLSLRVVDKTTAAAVEFGFTIDWQD